jgi:predicted permease
LFDGSDDAGVVLDHTFWTTALDADPSVVGRTIRVGNAALTILGVAPEQFAGTGMPAVAPNLWLPASTTSMLMGADWRSDGGAHWQVLGRRAPNASLVATGAELAALSRSVPDSVGKPVALVARPATFFQTDAGEFEVFQQASAAFLVALALMLSIAVVNLVNLFAARNASRESEVTVRLALGANRRRIARQLASESVLLAIAGGALGLVVSRALASWIDRWVMSTMMSISGGIIGLSLDLRVDWRVAAYAGLMSVGIGLCVGLWPALRASRGDVNSVLRGGSAATAGAAAWSKRHALLAVQIASCIVLLTASGALLAGMRLSNAIDPRFDAGHVLVVDAQDDAPAPERAVRREQIALRLAALPSVRAVAWTRRVPFGGTHLRRATSASAVVTVDLDDVSESYFDAIGVAVARGRTFTHDEVVRDAPVMLVSETAARWRWPNGDAIGRSVAPNDALMGPDTTKVYTVIGIVPDIRSQFLSRPNGPAAYYPYGLQKPGGAFLVRTRGEPASAINDVRAAVASIAPSLASRTHVITMQDGPMALQRLMAKTPAMIALVLALAGLALASVGVFGVISQIVTRRTREIGVHMALGAGRRRVLWLVATKTLRPVAWGTLTGCIGAFGLSLVLRSLVAAPDVPDLTFGAGAFNPMVFAGVLAVLLLVVAAAFIVPARRAVMVDPARALRAE